MLLKYDLVSLILIFSIHKVFSGHLKRSLTFVIDDTGSMSKHIRQVKLKTQEVFDAVINSKSSEIENFVLVTFNDPDVKLRTKTKEVSVFKSKLEDISVHGGVDCPEMTMKGISLGIDESLPYSLFYVSTDATAKDMELYEEVMRKALKKFIQVTFLLTGDCHDRESPNYKIYKDLADVTGGQVFNMNRDEVKTIMDYIINTIRDKKVTLYKENFPAKETEGTTKQFPFSADSKVQTLTLSLVGGQPKIVVIDSKGDEVKTEVIMKSKEIHIIKMNPVVAGDYVALIESSGDSNLDIKASSALDFQYRFLVFRPSSIEECKKGVPRPVAGEETYLIIELSNEGNDVNLESVELLDLNGNVIEKKKLNIVKKGDKFYVTERFVSPSDKFKIAVNGIDTSTKEKLRRSATTAVEPWNKKIETGDKETEIVPKIEELKINDKKAETFNIFCLVSSFPEPDIVLFDYSGKHYTGKRISIDVSSYATVFEITTEQDNVFYCKAINKLGVDEKSIGYKFPGESPIIDKSVKEYIREKGRNLDIFCSLIKGNPKATINWFHKHPSSNKFVKLPSSNKLLHFDKLGLSDAGTYKCKALNTWGFDSWNLEVYVQYPPFINSVPNKVSVASGKYMTLHCDVKGSPSPKVRWLFKGREITIGGRHNIYKNHTLSFIANDSDTGSYMCEASNTLGVTSRQVDVNVHPFIPASIRPPERRIYELEVGNSVSLDCVADGTPEPTVGWIYRPFQDGTSEPTVGTIQGEKNLSASFSNKTLSIVRVGVDEAGYYICMAANNEDNIVYLFYEIYVEAPPSIVTNLISNKLKAVVGDLALKIPCYANGYPKPDIIWMKNGLPIALGAEYNVENGTLILTDLDVDLAGTLTCIAMNTYGVATETFEVEVLTTPESEVVTEEYCIIKDQITKIECKLPHSTLDSVRWYKGKTLLPDPVLILFGKKSDSDIYTCRVSNRQGAKNYQFKVSSCSAPEFVSDEPNTINYVEDNDMLLRCDASGYPEPLKVVWYHNNRRLKDIDMFIITKNLGTFTCEVSNAYGEITRTFNIVAPNCTLDVTTDFAKPEPLLLTRTRYIPRYEIVDNKVNIPKNETILLHCRNSYIDYYGTKLSESITAQCDKDSIFITNTQALDFKYIKCHEPVKPLFRNIGILCSSARSSIFMAGYVVDSQFQSIYDVCFHLNRRTPIYIKFIIHKSMANVTPSIDYDEDGLTQFDFKSLYDCNKQKRDLTTSTLIDFYKKGGCFDKRQMVNPRDVFPGTQAATFKYLNVAPQWSLYRANWDEIESRVRTLVQSMDHGLLVWSGVSGHLSLTTFFETETNITISDKNGRRMIVPKYFWKIVFDAAKEAAVVIIQLNNPEIKSQKDAEKFVLCKDICDEIDWLRNPHWKDYTRGYTFCCSYQDFHRNFKRVCFVKGVKRVLL